MLLSTCRWMDPCVIVLAAVLLTVYLSTVFAQEDMEFLAERLTSVDGDDRVDVWHSDCFQRCGRHKLRETLNIACNYDPYRVFARRKRSEPEREKAVFSEGDPIFLTKRSASSFLHHGSMKRALLSRTKRNIVHECCYNVCAWEEYAEYCHGYVRRSNSRTSRCL